MQKEPQPNDQSSSATLPALLPPVTLLIQRTQTTLGLLHDLVQESSAEYWYERGKAAEVNIQWAEVAYAYRQCVERDTGHWRGAVRLAAVLGHLGQTEAAAGALTEASEAADEGWQTLVTELSEPTWHLLRDSFEAARSSAQDGFGLLLGLALVYRALKQGEQARRTLDGMQAMYESQAAESAQWFWLSGNLYSDEGDDFSHESIAEYDRAIELKLDYFSAYLYRGLQKSCFSVTDYAGAIADYTRVIELKPNCAAAYCNRGSAKANLNNYWGDHFVDNCIEIVADCDQAIELKPSLALAYRIRGVAKCALKNDAEAIVDFDRAIELNPDDDESYYERGGTRHSLNDCAGAVADYNRYIESVSNHDVAYFYRGLVKGDLQDYAGAVADFNDTIALGLRDFFIYEYRADAKEKLGDTTGAAADRERARIIQLMDDNESY